MPKPSTTVTITGKISYNDSIRAYTVIRLKQKIVDLFPSLRQNQGWKYQIEFYENHSALLNRIADATKNNQGTPLLLFIYSDDRTEN